MIRIAITGSIGMGKSTVARMFEEEGVPLFDADREVHRLQQPGTALVEAIGRRFPGSVDRGVLDREALSRRVLADPSELAALEALVHPAVQRERERFLDEHRDAPALAFDIPLLFETGADKDFDLVVVVSAPPAIQRERVLRRPGMSEAKLDAILSRQMPDSEKRRRATHVVDTGGPLEDTRAQVRQILACLEAPRGE